MVALVIVIDNREALLLTRIQVLEPISTLPKVEKPLAKPIAPLRKIRSVVLDDGRGVAGPGCPPLSKISWELWPET